MFGGTTGWSELRWEGCVLGYPGVDTWVNGGCPWRGSRGSERRRYVCIKMRTQVNTPCLPRYIPPGTAVSTGCLPAVIRFTETAARSHPLLVFGDLRAGCDDPD